MVIMGSTEGLNEDGAAPLPSSFWQGGSRHRSCMCGILQLPQ